MTTALVFDEEALSDPLVDNDESNLWRVRGAVVHFSEGLAELFNLFRDDLIALSITNTITEDDQVRGQLAIVVP